MSSCSRTIALAALSIIWSGLAAQADTLRCTSVNGNLNCAGSNGASCQTIDGKKVCVSGHGDVVQTFGNGQTHDEATDGRAPPRHRMTRLPLKLPDQDQDWPVDDGD